MKAVFLSVVSESFSNDKALLVLHGFNSDTLEVKVICKPLSSQVNFFLVWFILELRFKMSG